MTATPTQAELDQALEDTVVEAAREDPAMFAGYVLKDEQSGGPISLAPVHREWHALVTAHPRLVLMSAVELGKSSQLSVGRVLWELGRNPSLRVVIGSNTAGQASKLLGVVARYVEHSAELRRVFPHLKPDPSGPWNSTALTVQRGTFSKDPSIQAIGLHGNVLGSRVDLLVLDDPVDFENSRTPAARDDADRWVASTLLGRLTGASKAVVLGNPWHRDDLLARLEGRGWPTYRFPVQGHHGALTWPEVWPEDRIARARIDLGPREAARQLDCLPPADADPIIPRDGITAALIRGEQAPTEFFSAPAGTTLLSVDVAFSSGASADESAIVQTRLNAETGMREVVQVNAGRWPFDELCGRLTSLAVRTNSTVAVETNGGGGFVAEHVQAHAGRRVKVVRVHTSAASKAAAVDQFCSELSQGRWAFMQPGGTLDPQMRALVQEILDFTPQDHTGDRFAALLAGIQALRTLDLRPKGRVFDVSHLFRR